MSESLSQLLFRNHFQESLVRDRPREVRKLSMLFLCSYFHPVPKSWWFPSGRALGFVSSRPHTTLCLELGFLRDEFRSQKLWWLLPTVLSPSSRTHSQPVFPSLPCRQEVLWDWSVHVRSAPPPHLAHKVHHHVVTGIYALKMMEPGIEVTAQMRADHKYQSLLLMKICVEGLNAMVDGFCLFFWVIFCPRHSSLPELLESSHLIHFADLTKSALVRHIKKKKKSYICLGIISTMIRMYFTCDEILIMWKFTLKQKPTTLEPQAWTYWAI